MTRTMLFLSVALRFTLLARSFALTIAIAVDSTKS